jgi:Mn-dependent DtxR family transcriptional regulator
MQHNQYKSDSEREQQVLKLIADFQRDKGYSPSYSDLGSAIGVTKSRIAQIISSLIIKNLVTKDGNKARTLQICK